MSERPEGPAERSERPEGPAEQQQVLREPDAPPAASWSAPAPAASPPGDAVQPAYGPPPGYGPPAGYQPVPTGRVEGKQRSAGTVILLGIITLGVYWAWWTYRNHEDLKQATGQGLGGVVGLVIYLVASPVTAFLLPGEIKAAYEQQGRTSPVDPLTGLWFFPGIFLVIPAIIWFVRVQNALNDLWAGQAGTTSGQTPQQYGAGGYGGPAPA